MSRFFLFITTKMINQPNIILLSLCSFYLSVCTLETLPPSLRYDLLANWYELNNIYLSRRNVGTEKNNNRKQEEQGGGGNNRK
jgi:hypothetical protein